jgi:hypothetical protein
MIHLKVNTMYLSSGKENLKEFETKLRKIYPQLTDADLTCTEGNINDMLTMVAYKLRKTRQEINKIVEGL